MSEVPLYSGPVLTTVGGKGCIMNTLATVGVGVRD